MGESSHSVLQVIGLQEDTLPYLVGTCTFPLFQASKVSFDMLIFYILRAQPDTLLQTGSLSLRAGAHQEPLTLGRDGVPALSVLFRLLPHSTKHVAAPHYLVQHKQSHTA